MTDGPSGIDLSTGSSEMEVRNKFRPLSQQFMVQKFSKKIMVAERWLGNVIVTKLSSGWPPGRKTGLSVSLNEEEVSAIDFFQKVFCISLTGDSLA